MIVVLGDIAVDIISILRTPLLRGSDAPATVQLMPGGSGANVAVWLARLGQPVTFIGRVGDDLFGAWLRADLRAEGVEPVLITDPARGTGVIQVLVEPDGERTMVPDRGANACWQPEEIPLEVIASAELLHVVGYMLLDEESRPGALAAMAHARTHGVPVSLDPSSHGPLARLGVSGFWELVGRPDILLPNRGEARALTGCTAPEEMLAALRGWADVVAIKLDREGCLAAAGSEVVRVPAAETHVVNATGAGDAFNAGFLAAWLTGLGLAAACRAGVRLGTLAVTLPGSR